MAPFNWQLTIFGISYFVRKWRRASIIPINLTCRTAMRLSVFFVLIVAFFTFPCLLIDGQEEVDNHFVKTLRTYHDRPGRHVELDRNSYVFHPSGGAIRTFTGEELSVDGMRQDHSAPISVRGTFVAEEQIRVSQYHVNSKWFRNSSSYLGLFLVSILFIYALVRQAFMKGDVQISSE